MCGFREFSLLVDEHHLGHFCWVIESTEDGTVWREFKSSEGSYPFWGEALEKGDLELTKLLGERSSGPRATAQDEGAAPAAQMNRCSS